MSELWRQSAKELAALIANRKVSSLEVIDDHFARIEAVNSTLNAIVRVMADDARAPWPVAWQTFAWGYRC